jgi:hypothetical protein
MHFYEEYFNSYVESGTISTNTKLVRLCKIWLDGAKIAFCP